MEVGMYSCSPGAGGGERDEIMKFSSDSDNDYTILGIH